MTNMYISIVTTVVYFLIKFIEMRFVKKEHPSIKLILRDSILVGISSGLGMFIYDQFAPLAEASVKVPSVFTNEPDF